MGILFYMIYYVHIFFKSWVVHCKHTLFFTFCCHYGWSFVKHLTFTEIYEPLLAHLLVLPFYK